MLINIATCLPNKDGIKVTVNL